MNQPGSASTLVIIHSSIRAGGFTLSALSKVGLKNTDADLAYCGSAVHPDDNPYSSLMVYDWGAEEPADIGRLLKDNLPVPLWNYLLNPDNSDGLATSPIKQQLWLSGLIQWHYKKLALDHIQRLSLQKQYSWFIFLRSDYLFTTPLPSLAEHLPPRSLVLDGDNYGGINDRLMIFSRQQLDTVTKVFDLGQFSTADSLAELSRFMSLDSDRNPERLLHHQMIRTGLVAETDALPQLGFCVRPHDETSRWSPGVYSPRHDVFIKYPTELALSKITQTPFIGKNREDGAQRQRALASSRPRYVDIIRACGPYRATRLAPVLLLLGEFRFVGVLWRSAAAKWRRKILSQLSGRLRKST